MKEPANQPGMGCEERGKSKKVSTMTEYMQHYGRCAAAGGGAL